VPPNLGLQMSYLALDIQTFSVRIEDKDATIRVSDLWAFYLTMQLPFQKGHFPLPMMTVRLLSFFAQ
jgi:hypothetical protein